MPDFLKTWVGWLVSIVIVNIVINLIADYLKPYLDKIWAARSSDYRTKLKHRDQCFEEAVQILLNDPTERILMELTYVRLTILIVTFSSMILIALVVATSVGAVRGRWETWYPWFVIGANLLPYALVVVLIRRQARTRRLLWIVRNRLPGHSPLTLLHFPDGIHLPSKDQAGGIGAAEIEL